VKIKSPSRGEVASGDALTAWMTTVACGERGTEEGTARAEKMFALVVGR